MKLIKQSAIVLMLALGFASSYADDVKVKGGTYLGTVTIDLGTGDALPVPDQSVKITSTGVGTCDFSLDNFSLDGTAENAVGDILVKDVKTTKATGSDVINYVGSATDMSLAEGAILADVDIEGTETADRYVDMQIHVKWYMDPDDKANTLVPLEVTFKGTWDGKSGILKIDNDKYDQSPRYYTVDGKEAKNTDATGLYIVRRGTETEKVIVK